MQIDWGGEIIHKLMKEIPCQHNLNQIHVMLNHKVSIYIIQQFYSCTSLLGKVNSLMGVHIHFFAALQPALSDFSILMLLIVAMYSESLSLSHLTM